MAVQGQTMPRAAQQARGLRSASAASAGTEPEPGLDLPFAHVLVIAPQLDVAKDLASRVEAAGLRVDRGSSAEDLCAALGALPPPQVILVAVDDMLERARIRRALAASRRWTAVPVVEMGHGALHPHAVAAVIATHAIVA